MLGYDNDFCFPSYLIIIIGFIRIYHFLFFTQILLVKNVQRLVNINEENNLVSYLDMVSESSRLSPRVGANC